MTTTRPGAWLAQELSIGRERLRDRRRLWAVVLIGVSGGLVATFLLARGELAGSDALAYWAGIRIWLSGGDPYHPPVPYLPYVYAPWSLGLFVPWALLPWSVAWTLWRGLNIVLLIWSAHWAYSRRPLATAIALALLAAPIAATLDTGNITFLLAMLVWAAHFTGPRAAGLLWALATGLKWFPVFFVAVLPPRARLWGVAGLAAAGVLMLATWPETLHHLDLAFNFPRPIRIDLALLAWGVIPWLWTRWSLWALDREGIKARAREPLTRTAEGWRAWRASSGRATVARRVIGSRVRSFFGVG
ncbi:MAG: DUF2029 domain-containing protein [Chloroflexi bacterium]|nr:DUF2029 domain-containing protein [Chloroflexota bacterium]